MAVSKRSGEARDENIQRGNWTRQVEFTLSCIGYAVGLGNLWRFPYLCLKNGGGAFLIPYFFFIFACGLPLFFLELVLGQFSGLSSISVWKLCPAATGLGWAAVIICTITVIYYNVILAWVLFYFGSSLARDVPWKTCSNSWNTVRCVVLGNTSVQDDVPMEANLTDTDANNYSYGTNFSEQRVSAAEEFWENHVLNMSSGIDDLGRPQWKLVVCLLAAWIIVFFCLCKGVKSSGKAVYVTATVPYIFIFVLIIRGATLPGSLDGILWYLVPDWDKLRDWRVWCAACIQVFYSLGPAWGGLITMASYNRFHNNCLRDAVVVCVMCGGTSFLAGFVVFSVLGYMAHQSGVAVAAGGPGLAFVAYPEAISKLPISPLWSVSFFLMMLTVGLDSQFAMVETVISGLVDTFPQHLRKRKMLFVGVVCVICFALGLPIVTRGGIFIFQIMDHYTAVVTVGFIAMMEAVVISYVYGIGQIYRDMTLLLKKRPTIMWAVCWAIFTPLTMLIILIVSALWISPPVYGDYTYPPWAVGLGWFLALVSFLPIIAVPIYRMFIISPRVPFRQHCANQFRPAPDWGPALERYKESYQAEFRQRSWFQRLSFSADEKGPITATPLLVVAANGANGVVKDQDSIKQGTRNNKLTMEN